MSEGAGSQLAALVDSDERIWLVLHVQKLGVQRAKNALG